MKTPTPLMNYVREVLDKTRWGGRKPSSSNIRNIIADALATKTFYAVSNSNGHDYILYDHFSLPRNSPAWDRMVMDWKWLSNGTVEMRGMTFSRLYNGNGNNIVGTDLEVEITVSRKEYQEALLLLRDIIDGEIVFLEYSKDIKDIKEQLLTSLSDLIKDPVGSLNYIKVRKAIEENKERAEDIKARDKLIANIR